MSNTLMISEDTLKANSLISGNVDPKVVLPIAKTCQDIYMHPILGTALFEDILSTIATDSTLANHAAYKSLMDAYVQPCLMWYIVAEIGSSNTFKEANKGTTKRYSDNSTTAGFDDLIRLNEKYKNYAETYAQRLIDYLMANTETYPLYFDQSGIGIRAIYPKSSMYDSGIFTGNVNNGQYNDIDGWWRMKK